MSEIIKQIPDTISSNIWLIVVSTFGGLVLTMLKLSSHFMRDEKDKYPFFKYAVFFLFLIIGLPILGAGMTCVYLLNGDKISSLLAFQIGLSSPVLAQNLISSAADNLAKNTSPVLKPMQ
ncbi:TPA: hypothetical protein NPO21_000430 [Klebsiella variicola subsp. variicola]|nr:hypothetical protein [Klebsiella variicola subsp. variicola]